MKILYLIKDIDTKENIVANLKTMPDWNVTTVKAYEEILYACSIDYYDVLVIDSIINTEAALLTVKEIRNRQIFTPILSLIGDYQTQTNSFLTAGSDMCLQYPFETIDVVTCIRALKRRNTNYQSRTISFKGINLNRPDGKIYFKDTSLSVSPLEIEIFRLLTRASAPISISILAEKMNEPDDKVIFFAKCLRKKIHLLGSGILLEIKNNKCFLRNKEEIIAQNQKQVAI